MGETGGQFGGKYRFPAWVRWASVIWFAVWFPAYWHSWGGKNFLHVCDITVILTCAGLFWSSGLLLSSQAVATIVPDLLWDLDAGWRVFTGHNLVGGTEYMWDAHHALWVRLLSLFHIVWPVLLLWAVAKTGYDRRGFLLQAAIAADAIIASRYAGAAVNINYAFRDPVLHRAWGPALVHMALMWAGLTIVIYAPTHFVLARVFLKGPREG